jgi:hypothetical protein
LPHNLLENRHTINIHFLIILTNILEILLQWSKKKDKVVGEYRGESRRSPRTRQQSADISWNVTIEKLNDHLDDEGKFKHISDIGQKLTEIHKNLLGA